MTDDLVKRMRAVERDYDLYDHDIIYEAADRIEALEKALRYYAKGYENPFGDDDSLIARKALEGKND